MNEAYSGYSPVVAVALATYKSEKYILEQLESLLYQTRKIDAVLIADDSCDEHDKGLEIISSFIAEHNLTHWKLTINSENKGHAANFIDLCRAVSADYVFFCDQDDVWAKDKIERMLSIMELNNDVQMLCGDVINFNDQIRDISEIDTQQYDEGVQRIAFSSESYFFKGLGCASCVRGSFLRKVVKYWVPGWEHDMFFWACAILLDGAYMYDYPVVFRRLHESNASITGKKTREKRVRQVMESLGRPSSALRMLQNDTSEISNRVEKTKFLTKYRKSLQLRDKMLRTRNVLIGLLLVLFYQDCYLHGLKGILLDVYVSVFKST